MITKRKTTTRKPQRGFYVLERNEALEVALKALLTLRQIAKTKPVEEHRGLMAVLGMTECALNRILQFSESNFSDEAWGHYTAEAVPEGLEETRQLAKKSLNCLLKILKDARADYSVEEKDCTRLDDALDDIARKLTELLPPPGAPRKTALPF
jgi:hypothetical protein